MRARAGRRLLAGFLSVPVYLATVAAAYVAALARADAPGATATWVVTVGIAVGGAGLVGAMASWLRRLVLVESELAGRLREADEPKSTFLQAVSHELRTPLAVVRGYSETLDHHRERLEETQVVDMLGRLRGASKRLDELLTDLLDVERLQRGDARPHREPCNVGALVSRAVAETASPTHRAGPRRPRRVLRPEDPGRLARRRRRAHAGPRARRPRHGDGLSGQAGRESSQNSSIRGRMSVVFHSLLRTSVDQEG